MLSGILYFGIGKQNSQGKQPERPLGTHLYYKTTHEVSWTQETQLLQSAY